MSLATIVPAQSTSPVNPTSSGCNLFTLGPTAYASCLATSAASAAGSVAVNAAEATIFSSRVIAIVLGLILITGAILLYIGEDLAGAIETGRSGISKIGALAG